MSEVKPDGSNEPVSIKTAEEVINKTFRGKPDWASDFAWKNEFKKERDQLRAAVSSLEMKLEASQKENAEQTKRIAHQQFLIDSLMLEFCPDEITEEQWENWKKHQRKVEF